MGPAKPVAAAEDRIDDNLDWREHFKKQPVAWSLGAAGGGFLLGYTIAAIVKGESSGDRAGSDYRTSEPHAYAAGPILGQEHSRHDLRAGHESNAHREGRQSRAGLLERFQETELCDHLRREAAAFGRRFVGELSQTAQEVVLPVAISWFRQWLTELTVETRTGTATSKAESAVHSAASSDKNRARP